MIYIPQNLPFLVYSTAQFLINLQSCGIITTIEFCYLLTDPKIASCSFAILLIILSPRRLLIYFLSINLPVPDMSYRWNLTLWSLCLTFTWGNGFTLHVSTLWFLFGPGESAFPCMEMPCFVWHLTMGVSVSTSFTILNTAALNIHVHLCGHVFSFLFGKTHLIARLNGKCIFNLSCQTTCHGDFVLSAFYIFTSKYLRSGPVFLNLNDS